MGDQGRDWDKDPLDFSNAGQGQRRTILNPSREPYSLPPPIQYPSSARQLPPISAYHDVASKSVGSTDPKFYRQNGVMRIPSREVSSLWQGTGPSTARDADVPSTTNFARSLVSTAEGPWESKSTSLVSSDAGGQLRSPIGVAWQQSPPRTSGSSSFSTQAPPTAASRSSLQPPATDTSLSFGLPSPVERSPTIVSIKQEKGKDRGSLPTSSAASEGLQKKKKRRIALSCAECAKRKQKCNREQPCQHCIARRVPELCVPYKPLPSPAVLTEPSVSNSPQKTSRQDLPRSSTAGGVVGVGADFPGASQAGGRASLLPTLSVRVGRIEALLNSVVNELPRLRDTTSLAAWRINHDPALSPPPRDIISPSSEDQRAGYATTSYDEEEDEYLKNVEEPPIDPGAKQVVPRRDHLRSVSVPAAPNLEVVGPALPISHTDVLDRELDEQLRELLRLKGHPVSNVLSLLRHLPRLEDAQAIVRAFFEKVNWFLYPIDQRNFQRAFETVYRPGAADAPVIVALPLVFVVLAMGYRAVEGPMDELERQKWSHEMHFAAQSALMPALAICPAHVQLVEATLLMGLYCVVVDDRRRARGWQKIRQAMTMAQALNLHRDGALAKRADGSLALDFWQIEYRRRLWANLLHADASYSALLGKPMSIDPKCCDTESPSNIDDGATHDGRYGGSPKIHSTDRPISASYIVFRRRIADVVVKICQSLTRLEDINQYDSVERLHKELQDLIDSLPPHFRLIQPDISMDNELYFLATHRFYLQTELLHWVVVLHRPWLLRGLKRKKYQASRDAIFAAIQLDYDIRLAFRRTGPGFAETLIDESRREFETALVAGIALLIGPTVAYAENMLRILEGYLERHAHKDNEAAYSANETETIVILLQKASQHQRAHARGVRPPAPSGERQNRTVSAVVEHEKQSEHNEAGEQDVGPGRWQYIHQTEDDQWQETLECIWRGLDADVPPQFAPPFAADAFTSGSFGPMSQYGTGQMTSEAVTHFFDVIMLHAQTRSGEEDQHRFSHQEASRHGSRTPAHSIVSSYVK